MMFNFVLKTCKDVINVIYRDFQKNLQFNLNKSFYKTLKTTRERLVRLFLDDIIFFIPHQIN
jgi:hypothetical protein